MKKIFKTLLGLGVAVGLFGAINTAQAIAPTGDFWMLNNDALVSIIPEVDLGSPDNRFETGYFVRLDVLEGFSFDNLTLRASGSASSITRNVPSYSLIWQSEYWDGEQAVDNEYSVSLVQDSATSWLSFKGILNDEFALLSKQNNAFSLISRQNAGEKGITIASAYNVLESDNVLSIYEDLANQGGTLLSSFNGIGDFYTLRNIIYGNEIVSDKVLEDPVLGNNVLENSDLSTWYETADKWIPFDDSSNLLPYLPIKSTTAHSGNYSLQFQGGGGFETMSTTETNFAVTAEEAYIFSAWANSGTGYMGVSYGYGENDVDYFYNFTGDEVGTWTEGVDGSTKLFQIIGPEGTWGKTTADPIIVPTGVTRLNIILVSNDDTYLIDDVSFLDGENNEALVNNNRGFEDWHYRWLDSFMTGYFGDTPEGADGYIEREETHYVSAPYSAKVVADSTPENIVGMTEGYYMPEGSLAKFTFKGLEGTSSQARITVVSRYNTEDGDQELSYYVTGEKAGTWDVFSIEADTITTCDLTDEFTECVIDNIPRSELGTIFPVILAPDVGGEYFYVDDYELKLYTVTPVDYHVLRIKDLSTTLRGLDSVFNIFTSDDESVLTILGNGVFTSDVWEYFDFSQKVVKVGHTTDPTAHPLNGALNAYNGARLLAISDEIDLKTIARTLVYDMPEGYFLLPVQIYAETIAANNLSSNAGINLISSNGEGSTSTMMGLSYGSAVGEFRSANAWATSFRLNDSEEDIYVDLYDDDDGTSGTIKVYIIGILIPDPDYEGDGGNQFWDGPSIEYGF